MKSSFILSAVFTKLPAAYLELSDRVERRRRKLEAKLTVSLCGDVFLQSLEPGPACGSGMRFWSRETGGPPRSQTRRRALSRVGKLMCLRWGVSLPLLGPQG